MKKLMKVALSSEQIKKAVNTNLLTYNELINYNSLAKVLGAYKSCVILYTTSDNRGHWCLIFEQNPETIEFFDPYGSIIDSQLKYISESYKQKSGFNHTYLIKLILKSKYKYIEYNSYKFQSKGNNINTCGRHVITRLKYRNLNLDDYFKMIKNSGMNGDYFVTIETKNIS